MLERLLGPQQRSESARVTEPQRLSAAQTDVDVIVLAGRFVVINDPDAARHAEVHDRGAGIRVEQQVLGTPPDRANLLPGQAVIDVVGYGPAQPAVANNDVADLLLLDPRRDAAPAGFDFG